MKFLLILLPFLALTWAQQQECQCGGFVSEPNGEIEVVPFPPEPVENCEASEECAAFCEEEWNAITGNGDLDTVLENGETLGQSICQELAHQGHNNFGPAEVYLYYRVCEGPWQYDGVQTTALLCCTGGQYHACDGPPPASL
ncbi:uncharacterized protein [Cherax quadricarinatus]|uniref:uncharacterized protein n=1 Tax=Cherax quadricarinatus TaxID=27406 RepID=UPI00387E3DAD